MTSLLSHKTTLLEEQETKVARLKKQLEAQQKAMLNNKDVIKKLHEKVNQNLMITQCFVVKEQTCFRLMGRAGVTSRYRLESHMYIKISTQCTWCNYGYNCYVK